jgi:hypothetical protein
MCIISNRNKKNKIGGGSNIPKSLKISSYIRRNVHFLERLAKSNRRHPVNQLLAEAGPEQLLCVVECCLNLLRGRLPALKQRQLDRLRPHAEGIRAVSRLRSAHKVRTHLLQQKGGGVALLPIVLSTVLPIIANQVIDHLSSSSSVKKEN